MRILNRPMFRYGGPIREGVMHGMKNGGRAALVGNPVYPRTGGREHHKFNLSWLGLGAKPAVGTVAKPGFISTQVKKYIPKIKEWWRSKPQAGQGVFEKQILGTKTPVHPVKNWFQTAGPGKYLAGSPEAKILQKMYEGKGFITKPLKWTATQAAKSPVVMGGLIWTGVNWVKSDGSPANDDEIAIATAAAGKKPGRGDEGMKGTGEWFAARDAEAAKKLAKEQQNERLKSYLDMMGYDSAKKTAMSDALIDASALVQDATTEAGSIKKADWGNLINKAIQTTSKRLDKPEQIREAVGLMSVKAAIQKDLEDPQVKELRALQIKEKEKLLNAGPSALITAHMASRKGSLDAKDLAILMRDYGIQNDIPVGVITKTQVTEEYGKDGKPAMDIIKDKKITEDGIYVIGKEVIQIIDGKSIQLA
jgi:hypothetical protein